MNMSATTFNFSATVLLATLAFAPQFFGSAQAGVTSDLLNCKYNSRQKTVSCCEHTLKVNTRPLWLQGSNGSCSTMVKCVASKGKYLTTASNAKPKCYVVLPKKDDPRSGENKGTQINAPGEGGSRQITIRDSGGFNPK